jgi:hypothetical protein
MNKYYPFKHWIATVMIGPIPLMTDVIFQSQDKLIGFFQIYLYLIFFGLIFSTPTFVIYYLTFTLFRKRISGWIAKVLLNILALTGIFVGVKIIVGSLIDSISLSYSFAVIFSSLLIKINNENDSETFKRFF